MEMFGVYNSEYGTLEFVREEDGGWVVGWAKAYPTMIFFLVRVEEV